MARPRTLEGPHITFGNRLRFHREQLGWTQARATVKSEDTGFIDSFSHETLRRMEAGMVAESEIPTSRIMALAQAYDVAVSALSPYHADKAVRMASGMLAIMEREQNVVQLHPEPDDNPDGPGGGELAPVPSSSGNFGGPDGASRGNCWTGELTPVDQLAA